MSTPEFLSHIRVTKKDRKNLLPVISNWVHTHHVLQTNAFSPRDIGVMILLELEGRKRPYMVSRLTSRYHSMCREANLDEIKQVIKNG